MQAQNLTLRLLDHGQSIGNHRIYSHDISTSWTKVGVSCQEIMQKREKNNHEST